MAFKDVGARFMSRCLGYFNKDIKDSKIRFLLLLWAIQAALLQAVSWRKGVEVIILYPSGKVRYSGTPIDYIGTKYKSTEVDGVLMIAKTWLKKAF
jgi:threonine synthase